MANLKRVHESLFEWWRAQGRVLPWRVKLQIKTPVPHIVTVESQFTLREATFETYFAATSHRDPYRVIVAELMLQQTQVDRVLPKYEAWMTQWPSIQDLAKATLAEVLIFWQGLGYNRRARFLWLLAQEIALKRKGNWPQTEEELLKLPGIGRYTARAVLSFAFGQQVGVVDTNVKRIFERVFAHTPLNTEKDFFAFADQVLPPAQADPWNQTLMDFGALVCTAKLPKCDMCPLFTHCEANQDAIKQGFISFAEKQKQQLKELIKKDKKPRQRFADTDRFFRGRIMDELRVQSKNQSDLAKIMSQRYGLVEHDRFVRLVEALEKEGLVKKIGQKIRLGG